MNSPRPPSSTSKAVLMAPITVPTPFNGILIVCNVTVGRLTYGILNLMTGNEKFGNRKLIVGTLIRLKNFFIIANLLFIK